MCQRCGDEATIVHIGWGHQERTGLIRQILRGLEVKAGRSDDHSRLLDRLGKHLTEQLQVDRPVVLLVDEAQTLSDEALEELRLLSNFDTAADKLLQIALVGQPELRQKIRGPRHAALRQRIVMAKQLRSLNLAETHQYIVHRLRAAAAEEQAPRVQFDGEAVHQIYTVTGGVPRLINVACDNCLLLGYVRETALIDVGIVRRVVEDMIPNLEDEGQAAQRACAPMRLAGNF
jgi:general secretion pathway protein A